MYDTFGLFVLPAQARAHLFPSTATTLKRQRLSASDLSTDQGTHLSTDLGTDLRTDQGTDLDTDLSTELGTDLGTDLSTD